MSHRIIIPTRKGYWPAVRRSARMRLVGRVVIARGRLHGLSRRLPPVWAMTLWATAIVIGWSLPEGWVGRLLP